jgi:hypothetical protein
MNITIEGAPEEIADLMVALQDRKVELTLNVVLTDAVSIEDIKKRYMKSIGVVDRFSGAKVPASPLDSADLPYYTNGLPSTYKPYQKNESERVLE